MDELPEYTKEALADAVSGRHPGTVHLVRLFACAHLPEFLQAVSVQSARLALTMATHLADGPELSAGLRKLLEAKDCFVRAAIPD